HVPDELVGKTNSQLWQKYGLAIAGGVAPAMTTTDPKIQGLVGKPSTWRTGLVLYNVYSPKLKGYRANWAVAGQKKATEQAAAVDLRRGWNLVTQKRDDEVRSFLVFGGDRPKGKVKKGSAYSKGGKGKEPGKKVPKQP